MHAFNASTFSSHLDSDFWVQICVCFVLSFLTHLLRALSKFLMGWIMDEDKQKKGVMELKLFPKCKQTTWEDRRTERHKPVTKLLAYPRGRYMFWTLPQLLHLPPDVATTSRSVAPFLWSRLAPGCSHQCQ